MSKISYYKSSNEDGEVVIAYIPGAEAKIANSDHPNYKRISAALAEGVSDAEALLELFDVEETLRHQFKQLTDRVAVRNGVIFYDGAEVHNLVAETILRFMDDGLDFMPVVRFLAKLYENPTQHSIDQAWRWLSAAELTIHPDGDIVGYKGCDRRDGVPESTHSANADKVYVDGIEHTGACVPYPIGSTVVMPRDTVVHDPSASCSHGLHVGTFQYAKDYGNMIIEVKVNPADIVSVPNGEDAKMRVCKFVAVREITERYSSPLRPPEEVKATAASTSAGIDDYDRLYDDRDGDEPENVIDPTPEPASEVKHPSRAAFSKMKARAKSRRQNFVKYATKMGPWTLVGEDPTKRESWSVA